LGFGREKAARALKGFVKVAAVDADQYKELTGMSKEVTS
jgi:hypothetical protein